MVDLSLPLTFVKFEALDMTNHGIHNERIRARGLFPKCGWTLSFAGEGGFCDVISRRRNWTNLTKE
jgi:hypothetical protein